MLMLPGVIVRSHHNEQDISFFISNQNDAIQRSHYAGKFYEIEELRIISNWFGAGDILLDVGANIGNHTIFACKILRAKQSIVIEPNPPAIDMLRVNIDLNGLRGLVDMSLLGIGVSDADKKATAKFPVNNLGAARLNVDDPNGTLRLVPGDSIVRGRKIDFIKMDVEGHELSALRGLRGVIDDNRPKMFIEVENQNMESFQAFIDLIHYVIKDRFRRHPSNENFLVVPKERL